MNQHLALPPVATVGTARSAAMPVVFSDTVGLFMPARGVASTSAVLFLSPWGLEEMFVRKLWRQMAERLSDAGVSSLRFDYPGTGDAADRTAYPHGLAAWADAAVDAARELRALSACDRIIIIAQGLGVVIAVEATRKIEDVHATAFLAPVVSGRSYLRELQLWARMIDDGLGLAEHQRAKEGVSIASLSMPPEVAADVRQLNLTASVVQPAPYSLVAVRGDRPSDEAFAVQIEMAGGSVARVPYAGYDAMVANPSASKVPRELVEDVANWVAGIGGEKRLSSPVQPPAPPYVFMAGAGFRETPVTFGEGDRLYGILCEPAGGRRGAIAVLLGTAYDRHAGWGRMGVSMARELAASGISSFRFDAANVGDSPPRAGFPDQVLYGKALAEDVKAAIDFIEERALGPIMLVGRCSGAYQAFRSAVDDRRVRGVVIANPYVFEWDPRWDVDEALQFVPRSLDTYRERLFQVETFRRLFSGRIDVARALANIAGAVGKRLFRGFRPLLDHLPGVGKLHQKVLASFRALAEREVRLAILYSENDVGFDHLVQHFGRDGEKLKRYPLVTVETIEQADHNLTPPEARRRFLEAVKAAALSIDTTA